MQQPDEEMSVDIELEDGRCVSCEVITVLEVDGKNYVALLPQEEAPSEDDDDELGVWFYELIEDPDDENAEPELKYIESDEVFEAVADRFDEYLDELEFDEMADAD